ncbi:MAG: cyclic nucleotide-binding domain-containing protein [Pseudomonadota bacterium]
MGSEFDADELSLEGESTTQSNKAVVGYEVNDLREQSNAAVSDWMTRLLMNKEFQMVPAENLQAIFSKLEPINVKGGQSIIKQGDPGDYFYVITSGRCEVTRELPKGRGDVKLAELSVGDTFGEEALITGATRQASVAMLTAGSVMRLNKDDFNKLLSEPIVSVVASAEANDLVSSGGKWLNVDFAESHEQPDPENMVRIPTYLLRLKLDQLDLKQQYVVVSRNHSHARAAAHILRQSGFNASVLSDSVEVIEGVA